MKHVISIDPATREEEVLATFALVDGEVVATYLDEGYRREVELSGVWIPGVGKRWPRDGASFYDGLHRAYSNSSLCYVAVDELAP